MTSSSTPWAEWVRRPDNPRQPGPAGPWPQGAAYAAAAGFFGSVFAWMSGQVGLAAAVGAGGVGLAATAGLAGAVRSARHPDGANPWPWLAAICLAAVAPAYVALSWAGLVWLAPLPAGAAALAGVAAAWAGRRAHHRRVALERWREAVRAALQVFGRGGDAVRVVATAWDGTRPAEGWIDHPVAVEDDNPDLRARVKRVLESKLGVHVALTWQDQQARAGRAAGGRGAPHRSGPRRPPRSVRRLAPGTDRVFFTACLRPEQDTVEKGPRELAAARAETAAAAVLPDARADVLEFTNDDRIEAVRVDYHTTYKVASEYGRERIEEQMSLLTLGQEGALEATWSLDRDRVVFRRRRELPELVPHPVTDIGDRGGDVLPFAQDDTGTEVSWDLTTAQPHGLIVGPTGGGKALCIESPVPTECGWKRMGDLGAGDRVFDDTGALCTVRAAHPVMHDRDCYEMVFSDGSTLVADGGHLWHTEDRSARIGRREQTTRPHQRTPFLDPETAAALRRTAGETDPTQTVTLSDVTALAGLSHVPTPLRKLAKEIGPAGERHDRVTYQYDYGPVTRRGPAVPTYPVGRLLEAFADCAEKPTRDQRHTRACGQVRTTERIAATLRTDTGHINHSVPVAGPLQLPERDLPLAPYTLGAWLGDGTASAADIASAGPEVIGAVEAEGYPVRSVLEIREDSPARIYRMRELAKPLVRLGLLRDRNHPERSKHIPQEYLRAGEAQRRALLAGLLDTDGTAGDHGKIQFDNTNYQLAHGVHELVASLGYRPGFRRRRARLNGTDHGPSYQVSFTTADEVFRLPRKQQTHAARRGRHAACRNSERYIVDVRPVPTRPVRCITVDSPSSLYLAGEAMIPAHNTVAIANLAIEAARRGIEVQGCDPKRVELMGLRGWPGVTRVATRVAEMIDLLEGAYQEMHWRYDLIERRQVRARDLKRTLIILDEWFVLVQLVKDYWKANGGKGEPPVLAHVRELAAMARRARIHLLVGVQRPDANLFGEGARDNFRFRLSLSKLSPEGANMMWGDYKTGTDLPARSQGRAVVETSRGPRVGQVYYVPDPGDEDLAAEDYQLLQALLPAGASWDGPPAVEEPAGGPAAGPAGGPAERLLFLTREALRSRAAHLTTTGGGPPDDPGRWGWAVDRSGRPTPGGTCIGYLTDTGHGQRVYLTPASTLEAVGSTAAGLGESFDHDRNQVTEALDEAGVLWVETEGGQRRRVVRRLLPDGTQKRVWDLPAHAVEETPTDREAPADAPPQVEPGEADPREPGGGSVPAGELEAGTRVVIPDDEDEPDEELEPVTVEAVSPDPDHQGVVIIDFRADDGTPAAARVTADQHLDLAP